MQDEPEMKNLRKKENIVAFLSAAEGQNWVLGLPCPKQDLRKFGSLWTIQSRQGILVMYLS